MTTIAEQLFAAAAIGKRIVIREKTGKKYEEYARPTPKDERETDQDEYAQTSCGLKAQ